MSEHIRGEILERKVLCTYCGAVGSIPPQASPLERNGRSSEEGDHKLKLPPGWHEFPPPGSETTKLVGFGCSVSNARRMTEFRCPKCPSEESPARVEWMKKKGYVL